MRNIDNFIYWLFTIMGILLIFGMLTMIILVSLNTFPLIIIFPIIIVIISRKILWCYIKGIATLDNSKFPRF